MTRAGSRKEQGWLRFSLDDRWRAWLGVGTGLWLWGSPLAALLWAAFSNHAAPGAATPTHVFGERQWGLLGRSLGFATGGAFGSALLGLFAGCALSSQPRRLQRRISFLIWLPLVIPPFIHALSWISLAGTAGFSLHGFWASVSVAALCYWPVTGLLVWWGLRRVRSNYVEPALFGPEPGAIFWRIELGLIRPQLLTGFLLVALLLFSDYGLPSLFRLNTYPVLVFSQFSAFYDLRQAVLVSWPYIVIPWFAIALWHRLLAPRLFESISSDSRATAPGDPPGPRRIWLPVLTVLLGLSVLFPCASLLLKAHAWSDYWAAIRTAGPQIALSLLLAAAAATLAVCLGWLMLPPGRRSRGIMAKSVDFAGFLTIALPATFSGMGLIYLYNHPAMRWFYLSPLILVILYITRFLPYALRAQMTGWTQIGGGLMDAAHLSPASVVSRWTKIILPLLMPASICGWAFAFILSFQELSASLLVSPPGLETLAVRIYSLYHYGASNLVAALCVILLALSMLVLYLVHRLMHRCVSC